MSCDCAIVFLIRNFMLFSFVLRCQFFVFVNSGFVALVFTEGKTTSDFACASGYVLREKKF